MKRLGTLALALAVMTCVSAAHAQSTLEAPFGSGVRFQGTILIDPSSGKPYVASGGGGGTASSVAAYGPDAIGVAPTKAPLANGYVDVNGKIQQVAPATPLPTADQNAQATITAPGTAPAKAQGVQGADGTALARDGTDNTGVTQPNGGAGIRGWLSGIYGKVAAALSFFPTPGTCTDTPRTLTAGTSTTLLSAGTYKSVSYMDIGTNPMTFVEGTAAAVVGNGMALSGAQAAGYGGGFYSYSTPPSNAVQGISTAGTTVIVKVCN